MVLRVERTIEFPQVLKDFRILRFFGTLRIPRTTRIPGVAGVCMGRRVSRVL